MALRHRAPDRSTADGPDPTDGRGPTPFVLDAAAMTELAERHWMPLVRLATLLLDDRPTAEEVVQQSYEAVWRRRPDTDSPEQLLAYLRAVVVNGARSVGRRRGTAARHLALVRAEHEAPADADLLGREDSRLLREAVSRLPNRQREVLVLRYWARLSEAEIAHTLDVSTGTVKSTAHHALAALRARLDLPERKS